LSERAFRDVFGEYLAEIGEKYPQIVVLDADLSTSTRTNKFAKKFPNRFFNMGLSEQNMMGTALGFAISGKVPIVSGFTIFTIGRAWEFIRIACHDNLNLKIVTTHGGIVGEDGGTHNALEDISLMSSLPHMNIAIPADNIELIQILEYALNHDGPFYMRLPRGWFPKIHKKNYVFSIGEPDILKDGNDLCLIGTGYGSILSYNSAVQIEQKLGISLKVINLASIKPIDQNLLVKELKNIKGIVIVEEHNIYCGFGSILARIISEKISIPMRFLGVRESFGSSGSREKILDDIGLNIENIEKQVKDLIRNSSQ
jgi:transketolase